MIRRLLMTLAMAVPVLVSVPAAEGQVQVRDAVITSFDGTRISVHFFRASGVPADVKRPVVMVAHGFAEKGPIDPEVRLPGAPKVASLQAAGYNVVTWDARGHGSSGGHAMFNSPEFEVRDTRAIIDWIATQNGVLLDRAGDPRLGMTGASYGGMIQYLTAAFDNRVDVITPSYTAYSLPEMTASRHGKVKEVWLTALAAMSGTSVLPGLASPFGPFVHVLDPEAITVMMGGVAAGRLSQEMRDYLGPRSPSAYLSRVNIPTLIVGGTSDTLFPLINAVKDFTALKQRGIPVSMDWNCEGHSLCPGATGPLVPHFEGRVIGWFKRWLDRNPKVSTGAPFMWIADNESSYRTAGSFPPPISRRLIGRGSGTVLVAPTAAVTSPSAPFIGAQPSLLAVQVPIEAPQVPADIVGFPHLRLTYRGTALAADTWLYAQVLDQVTNRVVGSQVTPVPVVLDGRQRTLDIDLEAIATRATPGSRYVLQVSAGSLAFGLQRSNGMVRIESAQVSLPVVAPAARPTLAFDHAVANARRGKVAISARIDRFSGIELVVRRWRAGRYVVVARADRAWLAPGRPGALKVPALTRRGRYLLRAAGTDPYGKRVVIQRTVGVR